LNYLFCGRSADLNIGNGKTVSAVIKLLYEHIVNEREIWSNIKIKGFPYTLLTPENISEVLNVERAVVFLDELHAILDINHKITPSCKKHTKIGCCFDISELYRQIRKRDSITLATVQSYSDCIYRLKVVMQETIICEKYDISQGVYRKCIPVETGKCPDWHVHQIKQTNLRTGYYQYVDPEPYYGVYDTKEVIEGWQML